MRSRAAAGYALCNVGETWRSDGECARGAGDARACTGGVREIGDDLGAGVALNALGNLARSTGELEAAARWLEEALVAAARGSRCARDRHDAHEPGDARADRGRRHGAARRLIAEARAIYARNEDGPGLAGIAVNLGDVLRSTAATRERACALLEERVALGRGQDLDRRLAWSAGGTRRVRSARGDAAAGREGARPMRAMRSLAAVTAARSERARGLEVELRRCSAVVESAGLASRAIPRP